MASSEVEIASSAPFGCILRDHNSPRDRFGANSSAGTSSSSSFMLVQNNNEEDSSSSSPGTSSWAGPTNRWARVREKVAMEREEEREIMRTQSESAVDVPNMGGVSSLVRRWMDFAGSHLNSFSGAGVSDLPPVTPRNPVSEAATSEFGEDKFETEDSLTEWEVEGVDNVGKGSNSGERERPSVADVIKKLTTENQMQGSLVSWNNGDVAGERSSAAGNRGAWQSVASLVLPRIKGRQALADLVTQMERQRQEEVKQLLDRCAVSKFSHRARIQAMLRLRFMRRGIEKEGYSDYDRHFHHQQSRPVGAVAVVNRRKLFVAGSVSGEKIPRPRKPDEDHRRRRQESQSDFDLAGKRGDGAALVTECCDSKEKPTSVSEQTSELQCSTSSVVVLRERFNGGAEISCDAVNLKLTRRDIACCSTNSVGSCSNSDQLKDTTNPLPSPSPLPLPLQGDENQSTASNNADNAHSPESPCPTTKTSTNEQETNQEEEVNEVQEELTVSNHESSADEVPPAHNIGLEGEDGEDSMSQQWGYENDSDQYNGGNESDYDQLGDNNDWIMDISRPRSDWEDLRQERYQEMLDPFQHNQDIRELLQRGSVSSFLSSGLRQAIDSLMMSRVQPQSNSTRVRREEFVITLPQREPVLPLNNQQEEQVVVEEDAAGVEQIEEEEGNLIRWESDEVEWDTNNHDHNVTSLQQESSHLQHERTSRDNLQSSAYTNNRSSMELDFLNDLKGNIGLLHEEISELRRFLKLCISMQSKLQHSIKHDIAAAVKHEVSTVMVKSAEKETCPLKVQKGICCICYEMKVDSLLYRCGHMCTCFNCAHELQRSSGRCPICRSPIIDIVRPFIDS